MSIDINEFKSALSHFASGVTIIGYSEEQEMGGLTVTGFSSLSLNPPLVLITINKTASSNEKIIKTNAFSVNILSSEQETISNQFASKDSNKHELILNSGYSVKETGSPILKNCVANLDCKVENIYDGGDHSIIIGRVLSTFTDATKRPLLYFDRSYYKI